MIIHSVKFSSIYNNYIVYRMVYELIVQCLFFFYCNIIMAKEQHFLLVPWQLLKYSCHMYIRAKFLHIVNGEKLYIAAGFYCMMLGENNRHAIQYNVLLMVVQRI